MNDIAGPIHHAAAKGYTAKAEMYARGRPDYPVEIVDWLGQRLGVAAGKTVVDLGAGTGKFTRYLVATGAHVIAVEPVKQMREQLARLLPGIDIIEGTATAIPLPDNSADALICAQSFHWFATKEALTEIHRVLKPGGRLGLIWNVRDENVAWISQLSSIIAPYEGDTPRFAKDTWRQAFPFDGLAPLKEDVFHHAHRGKPDDVIINRLRSVSFIAALPAEEEAKVAAKIRALIDATPELSGQDEISVPYSTVAYWTEKIG